MFMIGLIGLTTLNKSGLFVYSNQQYFLITSVSDSLDLKVLLQCRIFLCNLSWNLRETVVSELQDKWQGKLLKAIDYQMIHL